jgi:hypothetical protein
VQRDIQWEASRERDMDKEVGEIDHPPMAAPPEISLKIV